MRQHRMLVWIGIAFGAIQFGLMVTGFMVSSQIKRSADHLVEVKDVAAETLNLIHDIGLYHNRLQQDVQRNTEVSPQANALLHQLGQHAAQLKSHTDEFGALIEQTPAVTFGPMIDDPVYTDFIVAERGLTAFATRTAAFAATPVEDLSTAAAAQYIGKAVVTPGVDLVSKITALHKHLSHRLRTANALVFRVNAAVNVAAVLLLGLFAILLVWPLIRRQRAMVLEEYHLHQQIESNAEALEERNQRLRNAETEARRLKQSYQRSEQSKQVFVSALASRIDAPIQRMMKAARRIERACRDTDATTRGHAHDVVRVGNALAGMVRDVIDLSHIEPTDLPLDEELAPAAFLLHEARQMMLASWEDGPCVVGFEDTEDPGFSVWCDPPRLCKAIGNLAHYAQMNAQFLDKIALSGGVLPDGSVVFQLSLGRSQVEDDAAEHITGQTLEPIDPTLTFPAELELSVAKFVVWAHHGTICTPSRQDRCHAIQVVLPASRVVPGAAAIGSIAETTRQHGIVRDKHSR